MAAVDLQRAEDVLRAAIKEVQTSDWEVTSPLGAKIGSVISGTHLTYRYILVNGLLAKATEDSINPITLQVRSELEGAYDARSLCHKVLVPLERELLDSRLGGSNEPFLNKPARFTELSKDNAVRKGKDHETLLQLICILGNLPSTEHAYIALKDAIYFVFQRPARDIATQIERGDGWCSIDEMGAFIGSLIDKSFEGETCALVGGLAFDILNKIHAKGLDIHVHPINQSGASSREISDIDVYAEDSLEYTIEVKDKQFHRQDVEHAISKAVNAGMNSLLFLTGPQASLQGMEATDLIQEWGDKGFDLVFCNLFEFLKVLLLLAAPITPEEILDSINNHAQNARVKDQTMEHIINCGRNMGWIKE